MKKEKFTPGPWVLKHSANYTTIGGKDWPGLATVVTIVDDHRDQEGISNAALIAAAPDLYKALKEAHLHIRGLLAIFDEAKEVLPSDMWGDFDSVLYLASEANSALPDILNLLTKARGENVE